MQMGMTIIKYSADSDPSELCEILRALGFGATRTGPREFVSNAPVERIHETQLMLIKRAQGRS